MKNSEKPGNIDTLPVRTVVIGGIQIKVKYDQKTNMMYKLDEQGNIVGEPKVYILDKETPQEPADGAEKKQPTPEPMQEVVPMEVETMNVPVGDVPSETGNKKQAQKEETVAVPDMTNEIPAENEGEEKTQNKSKILKDILMGLLAVAAIWAIVVTTLPQSQSSDKNQETMPTDTETISIQETEPDTTIDTNGETEAETTTEAVITVLASSADLIPGTILNADSFTAMEISEQEYRYVSAMSGIYLAEDMVSLQGLVATTYIPAGKYIAYDDIGLSYQPANPWEAEGIGANTVTLPVVASPDTLASLIWGNKVDMTIIVQTIQTNDNASEEEATEPAGLEHESSVVESMVIDTYKLYAVQILDILNSQQNSLFSRYSALAQIPSAYKAAHIHTAYQDEAQLENDIPAYIIISVSAQQNDVLSGLDPAAMEVHVANPVSCNGTQLQSDVHAQLREVASVIAGEWNERTEGAEENASEQ